MRAITAKTKEQMNLSNKDQLHIYCVGQNSSLTGEIVSLVKYWQSIQFFINFNKNSTQSEKGGHQSYQSHKQGNRDFGRIFIRTDKPKWDESIQETDQNGNTTTQTDTYRGNNTIYCHKILLHQFQNHTLPLGQFSFPFQFHLMNHLPGTFEEINQHQSLKAEIGSYNKNFENIKDHQELTLREPLKTNICEIKGKVRASASCYYQTKSCYISAVFDKNTYLLGETALLLIDVNMVMQKQYQINFNSHCALDILRIVILKNYITLSNGSSEQVFRNIVNRRIIGGLRAGQKAMEDDRIYMQVVLVDQDPSQGPIKPSSNGKLVKSVYELSATAILDQCTCCETNPEVKVPITILAPVQMDQNALPPQPPNWDPQVFDSQLIYLNNHDLYVKSQNKGMDQQMAKPYM